MPCGRNYLHDRLHGADVRTVERAIVQARTRIGLRSPSGLRNRPSVARCSDTSGVTSFSLPTAVLRPPALALTVPSAPMLTSTFAGI